jgi:hypothetical protein
LDGSHIGDSHHAGRVGVSELVGVDLDTQGAAAGVLYYSLNHTDAEMTNSITGGRKNEIRSETVIFVKMRYGAMEEFTDWNRSRLAGFGDGSFKVDRFKDFTFKGYHVPGELNRLTNTKAGVKHK